LMTKVAFRISDSASIVTHLIKFSAADGTWTATVECNDTITPAGTLYQIQEKYAHGVQSKLYMVQVLSSLPGGTNQVLGLIVPEMSPVGVVNEFLTQALADTLYEPLGGGGGGGGTVTEYNEDDVAPANPTGPTVVAIRADSLSAQGANGDWVALRATANGELYCKIVDSINVLGPLTDAQLRASAVPVSGPLTDAQLRATPVPVTGGGGGIQYTEGDTDSTITGTAALWEDAANTLRPVSSATPLPISVATIPSHPVTNAGTFAVQADTELPTAAAMADNVANPTVPGVGAFNSIWDGATWDRMTQPLTDTQLRATAVPVSLASVPSHAIDELPVAAALTDNFANPTTTQVAAMNMVWDGANWDRQVPPLTDAQLRATPVPVSGPLTDAQLRATPVPVTGGGGGTEYTEDVAAAADPIGNAQILVRKDTPAATVTTDGDNIAQRGSNFGAAYVTMIDNAGAFVGTGLTDTQLRATAVPVSLASVPSHAVTNAGTFAVQADTELPAAAALADNTANPTAPAVAAHGMVWDGATWDRQVPPLTDTQLRATAVTVALPTLAASDNMSNPTVPGVVAFNVAWDGSGWDRVTGDSANGMDVDVTRLPALVAGAQVIGKVAAEQISSAAPTQVAMSTTSATIKASNANRKGFMIFNDCTVPVFVKLGATASATSFNVKIPAAAVYEQPVPGGWVYTGVIDGILGSGSGNVYVTEV
jgi:hypothetical protein